MLRRWTAFRDAVASGALVAALAAPRAAHAHPIVGDVFDASYYVGHTFLPIGLHAAFGEQNGLRADVGVEASLIHFVGSTERFSRVVGLGLVLQTDASFSDPTDTGGLRVALGTEVTWTVLGMQTGVAYRTLDARTGDSASWFLGAFGTTGIFSMGAFLEVPFAHSASMPLGPAIGLEYTIKFPWTLGRVRRQ